MQEMARLSVFLASGEEECACHKAYHRDGRNNRKRNGRVEQHHAVILRRPGVHHCPCKVKAVCHRQYAADHEQNAA